MRRPNMMMCLLSACLVASGQAPTPDPGLEVQRLRVWVGHWKGDRKTKPTTESPGGRYTVQENDQITLGGSFLESRVNFKETGIRELWVIGYDPIKKNYPATNYSSNGKITSWTFTGDGNKWTCVRVGKYAIAGKRYIVRTTVVFAADKMSRIDKSEISEDGNTWATTAICKMAKVSPVTK